MGEQSGRQPGGTVTFLLTDVEGSSRLWESDPEAASAALARRQEIIRTATLARGGALPAEQGEGDSSVSVFVRASDAAACAGDIQCTLAAEPWPPGAEVRVRIALHTGEAELREDGTYQGAALNRCARVRSLGHGGQILLTQATYEVLVDGLAEGFELRDLGTYRLRDLARPEHVWQLCHDDLASAFPPLRSLDATANNLPPQLTSFVGREAELEAVTELVRTQRLVTLTGAGGSGKTRLALQVAARVGDDFPDGAWWVDLAPLADPALVPATLASVLGVRESPLEPITDTVVRFLSSRRTLVLLDNCEHLIDPCATLAARLTAGCSDVTLIATSREGLRVDGETAWAVPPLSLRDEDESVSEAVRLFVDRARAAQPKFALGEDTASAVGQICSRLDGIPLAIELAAARTRVLNVQQIAEALDDRFHLLTGGARTALPRQRTLESSVDWSHDLLSEIERIAFRRLSVFAGTFTLEAAQAVCADGSITSADVLDLLTGLVDRSLVHVADETRTQTRYRLLETIRDYARHKLTDAGEAEETRDRHLDHYVSFAERAAVGLESPGLVAWLERIDAELDNIRAALDWSARSRLPSRGASLVGSLFLYWFARGELPIGRARLGATVERDHNDPASRAAALASLCIVNYQAGDMVASARHGDEAVVVARSVGDERLLGRALHGRAWVRFWGLADRFAGWADFEEADELLRRRGDRFFLALNLTLHGWSLIWTEREPAARASLAEGLAIAEADGLPHVCAYGHLVTGFLDTFQGSLDTAVDHLDRALSLNSVIVDPYAEVFARAFRAVADVFRGDYDDARVGCERGLATALEHRSLNGQVILGGVLAMVNVIEGRIEDLPQEPPGRGYPDVFKQFAAIPLVLQARAALAMGRAIDAREPATHALQIGRDNDVTYVVEEALGALAIVARSEGDAHSAEDRCQEALDVAASVGHLPGVCDVLEVLGGAALDQGRIEEAVRILAAGDGQRERIGYPRFPAYRPSFDTDVAATRRAMEPDTFARTWEEGAALTARDAVAYARRGRGKRKRPTHGWESLTPTELQVVDLVCEGLTNPQIGERMFVSPRTAQTHLAHIFAKLGVSTRAQLAAASAQRSVESR